MKDYTTLKNDSKEVNRKILDKVSLPLIPVLPDPSKREESVKAIIDTRPCIIPDLDDGTCAGKSLSAQKDPANPSAAGVSFP